MTRATDQRASDAERDEVVERLRAAAGEGRITPEELDERVATALEARTYRELHAVVADIPGPRVRGHGGGRMPERRQALAGWALETVRANPFLLILVIPFAVVTVTMVIVATLLWVMITALVLIFGGNPRGTPWTAISGSRSHSRHRRWA